MAGTESVGIPQIAESPVSLECRVTQKIELGSHTMFVAEVVSVSVDEKWMDETGRFHLEKADPIVYSHGTYYGLGEAIGTFGYSVAKKKKEEKMNRLKKYRGLIKRPGLRRRESHCWYSFWCAVFSTISENRR